MYVCMLSLVLRWYSTKSEFVLFLYGNSCDRVFPRKSYIWNLPFYVWTLSCWVLTAFKERCDSRKSLGVLLIHEESWISRTGDVNEGCFSTFSARRMSICHCMTITGSRLRSRRPSLRSRQWMIRTSKGTNTRLNLAGPRDCNRGRRKEKGIPVCRGQFLKLQARLFPSRTTPGRQLNAFLGGFR
jgi:hypothetical protein